ncbi:MAG: 5-formyltetrahydrofolate cyclo-ligase [Rubricoccaceae bacterium]
MMETEMEQVRAEKARLRERFRAARLDLAPSARHAAALAIAEQVQALPEWNSAHTVALYWPLLSRGEVDTRPLLDALATSGRIAAFPAVASVDPPRLVFRQLDATELATGRWGLMEPPEAAPVVAPDRIELVIVPAFGAGRNGARIGHGGGFYDAFLPTTPAPRVGVVYADCLIDHVPSEPHDAALDLIVTEHETVRVSRNPAASGP